MSLYVYTDNVNRYIIWNLNMRVPVYRYSTIKFIKMYTINKIHSGAPIYKNIGKDYKFLKKQVKNKFFDGFIV